MPQFFEYFPWESMHIINGVAVLPRQPESLQPRLLSQSLQQPVQRWEHGRSAFFRGLGTERRLLGLHQGCTSTDLSSAFFFMLLLSTLGVLGIAIVRNVKWRKKKTSCTQANCYGHFRANSGMLPKYMTNIFKMHTCIDQCLSCFKKYSMHTHHCMCFMCAAILYYIFI